MAVMVWRSCAGNLLQVYHTKTIYHTKIVPRKARNSCGPQLGDMSEAFGYQMPFIPMYIISPIRIIFTSMYYDIPIYIG